MPDVFTAAQSAVQPRQSTALPPTQASVRSAGRRIEFAHLGRRHDCGIVSSSRAKARFFPPPRAAYERIPTAVPEWGIALRHARCSMLLFTRGDAFERRENLVEEIAQASASV
jgi:hypothetical protein